MAYYGGLAWIDEGGGEVNDGLYIRRDDYTGIGQIGTYNSTLGDFAVLPGGTDGYILSADNASTYGLSWIPNGGSITVNSTEQITLDSNTWAPGDTVSIGHLVSPVVPGAYGSATLIPSFTVDAEGHITDAENLGISPITAAATAPIMITNTSWVPGGAVTIAHATAGAAGTYGDASNVPQFTTNATGHITGVTLVPIVAGPSTALDSIPTRSWKAGTGSSVGAADCVAIGNTATASGLNSIAIGSNAQALGTNAIAIGLNSDARQDTISIGTGAGTVSTSTQNLFIGTSSGANIIAATGSTFAGFQSGISTTGSGNTLYGHNTASSLTSGTFNTILGNAADCASTSSSCVIIGASATVTGSNSIVIGNLASSNFQSVTIGWDSGSNQGNSVIIGYQAAKAGGSGVIIGSNAGLVCTAASSTIIGTGAGGALTTGVNNTLIGSTVGSVLITGLENCLIGDSSNVSQTFGSQNTALGTGTLCAESSNLALGYFSRVLTSFSCAIGYNVANSLFNSTLIGSSVAAHIVYSTYQFANLPGNTDYARSSQTGVNIYAPGTATVITDSSVVAQGGSTVDTVNNYIVLGSAAQVYAVSATISCDSILTAVGKVTFVLQHYNAFTATYTALAKDVKYISTGQNDFSFHVSSIVKTSNTVGDRIRCIIINSMAGININSTGVNISATRYT